MENGNAEVAPNQPPTTPDYPYPKNGENDQPIINLILSWDGGDVDGDTITYNVYFEPGDSTPDALVSAGQARNRYKPGTLAYSTTYYWQIIATDEHGSTTQGSVWRFTTGDVPTANQPPFTPNSPSPDNGAADQPVSVTLAWSGGDPDGDIVTYDVYFEIDDSTPDKLVYDNLTLPSYNTHLLDEDSTYYWQIVSTDEHGTSTPGPVWSFSIGVTSTKEMVIKIAVGFSHTCALTYNGGVKCWGDNSHGQLGDGTTIEHHIPADVFGLDNGVTAIAAGANHTCALTASGGIKCWGDNFRGQLGDGSEFNQRLTAVDVSGLTSGVKAVATGFMHTCALTDVGSVKCWGWNSSGQLGDGAIGDKTTPTNVSGLSAGVKTIATGRDHNCALTEAGDVMCWGSNRNGQLGDGTTINRNIPTNVSGLPSGISALGKTEDHTCAVTTNGGVLCWGRNEYGQLGDGTTIDRYIPTNVYGLSTGLISVDAGYHHTCALSGIGGVKCWGIGSDGTLGDGTGKDALTPVDVIGFDNP